MSVPRKPSGQQNRHLDTTPAFADFGKEILGFAPLANAAAAAAPNPNPAWNVDARILLRAQAEPYDHYGVKDPAIVFSGGLSYSPEAACIPERAGVRPTVAPAPLEGEDHEGEKDFQHWLAVPGCRPLA